LVREKVAARCRVLQTAVIVATLPLTRLSDENDSALENGISRVSQPI